MTMIEQDPVTSLAELIETYPDEFKGCRMGRQHEYGASRYQMFRTTVTPDGMAFIHARCKHGCYEYKMLVWRSTRRPVDGRKFDERYADDYLLAPTIRDHTKPTKGTDWQSIFLPNEAKVMKGATGSSKAVVDAVNLRLKLMGELTD